ncbi:hypothetical protein JVT61DRAFT_1402 [Boletus reticuloceps]|uniref:GST N-terminal domain-containing protein n=1 Tax=Boletus reticuloceps TaxID=495285 RepID=A0A8I3A1Z9_9AGAM|nr:hypothetical protein JVT61DRAFT_1402 [Boletus reticuloceps]
MMPPPFTVIGTPFSTFTRTYKGITFSQVRVVPYSDTAYEHQPFGFLPTLVIHELNGQKVDLKLRESQQMWEFVSFIGAYGFPALEKGVVKPCVAATNQGTLSDAKICCTIAPTIAQHHAFLNKIEMHMFPEGYIFGKKLSWADFFSTHFWWI